MGVCGGKQAPEKGYPRDDSRDDSRRSDVDEEGPFKLLFLGAGESGKSTLFKRLKVAHGPGFTESELISYAPHVHENVISSMKQLIAASQECQDPELECNIAPELENEAEFLLQQSVDPAVIDARVADAITTLWTDNGIKNTFRDRSRFQCLDSAEYFFSRVKELAMSSYVPTYNDVLRCRDRTTGILSQRLSVNGSEFEVFDVGGQRAERKKWINCFQNVKTVLFVVAISEFDQVCFEDEVTNRLQESLTVFDNVCNSKWFEATPMILLFNKIDLFKEKVVDWEQPLSIGFQDYDGPRGDYDAACDFIWEKFRERNKTPKKVYRHYICATAEEDHISKIFSSITEIQKNVPLQ